MLDGLTRYFETFALRPCATQVKITYTSYGINHHCIRETKMPSEDEIMTNRAVVFSSALGKT
ncbi:MAG: hypothetical protein FWG60_01315, partial [Methanomassiliicoccaceae archaeon]|nr:hypothetical protein [Methanomassiliicoccaceae archaeon]